VTAVVVGLGQALAGDDGVGPAVARALAADGMDAHESGDASELLAILAEGRPVVVVDAVVGGGRPGDVLHLRGGALAPGVRPISSHGLGVAEALELARALHGDDAVRVEIVGVVIERPRAPGSGMSGMSPAVAAAVAPAAALARRLAAASPVSPSAGDTRPPSAPR
jgi:hydrogenase maturation protease